jgi:hypothetical protein
MDFPDPRAEFLAAHSRSEWTLAVYDWFNGEYAVLSRHATEALVDAARATYAASQRDVTPDELVVLPPWPDLPAE